MTDMVQRDERVHLEFKIATRGVMGLRTRILNATRGEATLFHHFAEYGPYRGDIGAARQRLDDRDEHRQVRRLRARRAADARQALRRSRRHVLRGHDRRRARQGQRPRRQRREGQAADEHARGLGRQGHPARAADHLHARGGARVHRGRRARRDHAEEHPAAQAAADARTTARRPGAT